MDCVACPIKAECSSRKNELVKSYTSEMRANLGYLIYEYCPLVEVAGVEISRKLSALSEDLQARERVEKKLKLKVKEAEESP